MDIVPGNSTAGQHSILVCVRNVVHGGKRPSKLRSAPDTCFSTQVNPTSHSCHDPWLDAAPRKPRGYAGFRSMATPNLDSTAKRLAWRAALTWLKKDAITSGEIGHRRPSGAVDDLESAPDYAGVSDSRLIDSLAAPQTIYSSSPLPPSLFKGCVAGCCQHARSTTSDCW